jgi:hypothetical protein
VVGDTKLSYAVITMNAGGEPLRNRHRRCGGGLGTAEPFCVLVTMGTPPTATNDQVYEVEAVTLGEVPPAMLGWCVPAELAARFESGSAQTLPVTENDGEDDIVGVR